MDVLFYKECFVMEDKDFELLGKTLFQIDFKKYKIYFENTIKYII